MEQIFRPMELFNGDLPESNLGPPDATVIGGPIAVRSSVEYRSVDGSLLAGVWEANPGLSRWDFTDHGEVIHVLEGSMTVRPDGGDAITVVPGVSAVFPIGWSGTWEIHERIRKQFVVFTA